MIESIRIPKERVGVLKDPKVKKEIKEKLNTKISFEENSVLIEGEGLEAYQAKNIVKAIGRGFAPVRAFRLFNDEEVMEIIELQYGDKKNERVKSRVIGSKGRMREEIELNSKASISVYGKTICIIGTYQQIKSAKEAIEMLIKGAEHKTVYNFLQRL
ncbi:MAG: KH domain-containing protein [Nanoarchaeota archaeon]|nr:KH domain-containing protein [Nanoarchaeota archaeon]